MEGRRERWEQEQLAAYQKKGKRPPKNWRSKYKEPSGPDVEGLPALPTGWVWTSLGQCFEVRIGATPSRSRADFWGEDIHWISSGEVQFRRITETKECITEAGLANSSTRINSVGSVLLGMIGEGRTRGQAAIQDIAAANNQNCAAILVSETAVVPEYIYYWLWSRYEITRNAGSGNNQPALNKSRVQNLLLALPPVAEQEAIVAEIERRLSILREVEAEVEVNMKRASRLRESILKRAFEGTLVPQHPNDEPATALLVSIRQERTRREQDAQRTRRSKRRKSQDTRKGQEMRKQKKRRPLQEVLFESDEPLRPQELFDEAGFESESVEDFSESVEDFYVELREEVRSNRIEELRPNVTDVYLKAVEE